VQDVLHADRDAGEGGGRRAAGKGGVEASRGGERALGREQQEGVERRLEGVFHCCGSEAIDRRALALRATEAFGLDPELLDFGPPPAEALPPGPVPYDTSVSGRATERALDTRLPDVETLLAGLRAEREGSLV